MVGLGLSGDDFRGGAAEGDDIEANSVFGNAANGIHINSHNNTIRSNGQATTARPLMGPRLRPPRLDTRQCVRQQRVVGEHIHDRLPALHDSPLGSIRVPFWPERTCGRAGTSTASSELVWLAATMRTGPGPSQGGRWRGDASGSAGETDDTLPGSRPLYAVIREALCHAQAVFLGAHSF